MGSKSPLARNFVGADPFGLLRAIEVASSRPRNLGAGGKLDYAINSPATSRNVLVRRVPTCKQPVLPVNTSTFHMRHVQASRSTSSIFIGPPLEPELSLGLGQLNPKKILPDIVQEEVQFDYRTPRRPLQSS